MLYHFHISPLNNPIPFSNLLMYQLGRAHCKSGEVIKEHTHGDFFELSIVWDGMGEIEACGTSTTVKKGDIFLSFPHETHAIYSDASNPLKYDFFAFQTESEQFRRELIYLQEIHSDPNNRVFHSTRIPSLIENAIAEIDSNALYTQEMLGSLLHQVLLFLFRDLTPDTPRNTAHAETHASLLCYRMMNYIDTHLFSMRNLTEIADSMSYSYKYLSELFHKTTATTIAKYYRQKKLDTAAELLLRHTWSITQISEFLNYSTVYSFSKAFSHHFGISPKEYRKKNMPLS